MLESPIGKLLAAETDDTLRIIRFSSGPKGLAGAASAEPLAEWEPVSAGRPGVLRDLQQQLNAYFAGRLRDFEIPLDPQGTDFQRSVWEGLRAIPYGQSVSYGVLAERVGRPTAARAVGAANGRNPIPIVIPCHRVIGSSGKLTGFGGGLATKQALLELEAGQT
jgi:methylated-DNA-[protein]-cysteine S-methyltransferase